MDITTNWTEHLKEITDIQLTMGLITFKTGSFLTKRPQGDTIITSHLSYQVRWKQNCYIGSYRYGADGKLDLTVRYCVSSYLFYYLKYTDSDACCHASKSARNQNLTFINKEACITLKQKLNYLGSKSEFQTDIFQRPG